MPKTGAQCEAQIASFGELETKACEDYLQAMYTPTLPAAGCAELCHAEPRTVAWPLTLCRTVCICLAMCASVSQCVHLCRNVCIVFARRRRCRLYSDGRHEAADAMMEALPAAQVDAVAILMSPSR